MLARWRGWGAYPQVFDRNREHTSTEREALELIERAQRRWPGYQRVAARTMLNAHYTDEVIIDRVWGFLRRAGVDDTAVAWEPGCGAGAWMNGDGAVPVIHGDELDPVTAQIATWSTPESMVVSNRSITDTRLPDIGQASAGYDLVVGNVPFADVAPAAIDNPDRLSLHNYALVKGARMLRPGGLMAVITSRWTLDAARGAGGRDQLAELCDLVAAVRLPTSAHRQTAGTEVVTDLLVLRRSETPEPWPQPTLIDVDDVAVAVSAHFVEHPDRMLGTPALGGMRGRYDLRVVHPGTSTGDGAWLADLERVLATIPAPEFEPHGEAVAVEDRHRRDRSADAPLIGTLLYDQGRFWRVTEAGREPYEVRPRKDIHELHHLIELRDLSSQLLDAEVTGPTAAEPIRHELADRYRAYTARYGPINRYSVRLTARRNSGEDPAEATRRVAPTMGGFRRDPRWWNVAALENFDDETQHATPAPILLGASSRSVDYPTQVDEPDHAITVLMARHGRLDTDAVADIAAISPTQVDDWLGDHAYRDPATGELTPAATYLSGHVVDKLAAARVAAEADPGYERNVTALVEVQPKRIPADEIVPRIGASWIPASDLTAFVRDVLELPHATVAYTPALALWEMRPNGHSLPNTLHYGLNERHTAMSLMNDIANQRITRITRTVDERPVLDIQATEAAAMKRVEIEDVFAQWVWDDPHRAERLEAVYNDRFNSYVEPRWDGSSLTFEGLAASFEPRPHQRDAVQRILSQRDAGVLLAHCVGAGKTAVMAMASMEMRRMGIVDGPVAVVVPNSMLHQFTREVIQLYPHAHVLAADEHNFAAPRRREFVARAATGDYDIVVFTHTAFELVPMSVEAEQAFLDQEIETLTAAMYDTPDDARRSVKQIERMIARAAERAKTLANSANKDRASPVTFEQLQLGAVMVDEAHLFKNLSFPTKIQDAAPAGSQRSRDLLMKADWLREHRGPAALTFATATPVSNRISEMWVMQRFLDPGGLARADIEHFDQWAATFARAESAVEVAPSGRGFRTTTRFSSYTNVPELARLFRSYADVRTEDQLDLPRPALAGGGPQAITVAADDTLHEFMDHLVERAETVKSRGVAPEDDNMLAIATDGRLASLDLRLVHPDRWAPGLDHGLPIGYVGPKLQRAADEIAARYHTGRQTIYRSLDGLPLERTGSTQVVFCDAGTPSNNLFNAYDQLVTLLAERDVPPQVVAFAQDATNHLQRSQLFARVRSGEIAVLIGSTSSMGVGVNVQDRITASHILTPPWRPDEVKQAEGRSLRQGNQNAEVELLRYVVEGSYDAYSWQTVERKANFVDQVMTAPDQLARELRDDDDHTSDYALLKALATGDPRILQAAKLEARVTQLERAHAMDQRTRRSMTQRIKLTEDRIDHYQQLLTDLPRVLARRNEQPAATPDGHRFETGADLGRHVLQRAAELKQRARYQRDRIHEHIATLDGLAIHIAVDHHYAILNIDGIPPRTLRREIDLSAIHNASAAGIGTQLRNMIGDLDRLISRTQHDLDDDRTTLTGLHERSTTPWPHTNELHTSKATLQALQAELMDPDEHRTNESEPASAVGNPAGKSIVVAAQPNRRHEPRDRRDIDRLRAPPSIDTERQR